MSQNIAHAEMVRVLAKPGDVIQEELTGGDAHAWHMATGIVGEAGEIIDAVKKAVIYRKPLDRANLVEELGDMEFYLEGLRQAYGVTREETITGNMDKLAIRYNNYRYSDHAARERVDKQ